MDHNAAFVTFIREHRDDVLREWERRVRALPPAADLDTASLIDHLPHLLEEIADLADAALGGDEKAASCNQPDRHAIARLDQGYDLGHVVTEYSLLRVLVQNAGKVVTHRQLLRTVWGEKAESQAQYLRVYVTHLRKKLEPNAEAPSLIKTEVGIGYRLSTEGL